MRKLAWLLTLLMILTAVPWGAAFASPEQTLAEEVVVGKFIFEGYWDIWGANGKWTNNTGPGSKNLSVDSLVVYPSGWAEGSRGLKDLLRRYELTRAEVKYVYPFGEAEYNDAGKRYDMPWVVLGKKEGYYWEHYRTMPNNPRAEIKSFDPQTGATVVKWTIDYPAKLNPADPKSAPRGPEDKAKSTKDWLKNGEWDKIDLRFASKTDLDKIRTNKALEGWRVYFPAIVAWYGIPKPEVNLIAVDIDPGVDEPEPGQKYTGTVTFYNASDMPLEDVPVAFYNGAFRGYLKDDAGNTVTSADFAPGEEKTFNFTWTAPGTGEATLKGVIDTPPLPDNYAETDESDNIVEVRLSVIGPPPPSGPGSLTFTAVSQSGKYTRPPGTAKWTDWVTATLTVPAPTPPKGTLKSWSITSAKLTYPKKHPWFTFGSPWPPQGTKTINMTPQGHTATAKFQEDWSLNGAPVYARYIDGDGELVDEGEVPGETYYPITATYTVHYTYEYQVRHRSCSTDANGHRSCDTWYETKTGSGTDSGTVSGRLLVDGSGVNSL
ncbi:MAG: hypothetical protein QMC81_02875 [Thermoanaerobacterales bacterium]|nr:hypothetical protein [Thermoanaerobacterales bacterium]